MKRRRRPSRPLAVSINGRFLVQDVTGVQRVGREFLSALDSLLAEADDRNTEFQLLVPAAAHPVDLPTFRHIVVRPVGRLTGHLWEQVELPLYARGTALLCLGNLAPVARLLCARPRTYTMVHSLAYECFPSAYSAPFRVLYGAVVPLVLARSSHVFTVSHSERQVILRRHPKLISPKRLTATPNGGGEAAWSDANPGQLSRTVVGSDQESLGVLSAPRILYVGSLSELKNARALGLVFSKIVSDHPDASFVIAGSTGGGLRHVDVPLSPQALARSSFLGQINDRAVIEEQYRSASALFFPSQYESSSLPPVEAMSFRCPVVCSDIPSLRERCGDAAVYADPQDPVGLARALDRVIADGTLRNRMRSRGIFQARQFTWRAQAASIVDRIEAVESLSA